MARNTYLLLKELVRDCIKAGRLRELDEDVIATALAASDGLKIMILYCPNFLTILTNRSDVIAQSLVDSLLREYQKQFFFTNS